MLSPLVVEMAADLQPFVEAQVCRSSTVSRLEARARTFIRGLFAAYYRDSLRLDDYVLLRYRTAHARTYLRDLPATRSPKRSKPAITASPSSCD